jgi:hypothetical protein
MAGISRGSDKGREGSRIARPHVRARQSRRLKKTPILRVREM